MDHATRRNAILRHIARYGLSLRPVLDRVFFDGEEGACASDLEALRRAGALTAVENAIVEPDSPQTRYSYYYLTSVATRELGVSAYLARAPGSQALARALAVLWFCCLDRQRRHRMSEADLVDVFGERTVYAFEAQRRKLSLKGLHCLHQHHGRYRVYHVYVPKTSVADAVVELRKRIREAKSLAAIRDAIDERRYGFALLAESIAQREALRDAMAKLMVDEGVSFTVVWAPGPWRRNVRGNEDESP